MKGCRQQQHTCHSESIMLTPFQRRWGIVQWVAYLKDKEVPVLPETRDRLAALREEQQDLLAPKELAGVVFSDPFLALKLLRRVEGRHSTMLEHETTTALASVLQAGVDDLVRIVDNGELADESLAGMRDSVTRTVLAAHIGRSWASMPRCQRLGVVGTGAVGAGRATALDAIGARAAGVERGMGLRRRAGNKQREGRA